MSTQPLARALGLVTGLILVMSLVAAQSLISAPTARAGVTDSPVPGLPNIPGVPGLDPCNLLSGVAKTVCKAATDPVGAVNTAVGDIPGIPKPSDVISSAATAAGHAIANTFLDGLVQSAGESTVGQINKMANFINSSSTPNLLAPAFIKQYELIFALAILVAIILFYYRTSRGLWDQDVSEAGKAGAAFIVFFIAATFLPGVVFELVKTINNDIAPAWMNTAGVDAKVALSDLSNNLSGSLSGDITGLFGDLIILIAAFCAGLFFELEFLFVYIMLPIVTALEIVALAFMVGGQLTRQLFTRCTYLLIGLICFKLIAAVILTFAITTLVVATNFVGGVSPFVEALVILAVAPFATWGIFKTISQHQGDAPHTVIMRSGAYQAAKNWVRD